MLGWSPQRLLTAGEIRRDIDFSPAQFRAPIDKVGASGRIRKTEVLSEKVKEVWGRNKCPRIIHSSK